MRPVHFQLTQVAFSLPTQEIFSVTQLHELENELELCLSRYKVYVIKKIEHYDEKYAKGQTNDKQTSYIFHIYIVHFFALTA